MERAMRLTDLKLSDGEEQGNQKERAHRAIRSSALLGAAPRETVWVNVVSIGRPSATGRSGRI